MNHIFKIKKEERLFVLIAMLIIIAFNVLMVTYHFSEFTKNGNVGYWTIFTKNFQVSGFDPYTYLTLSKWKVYYTEYRHPMLPFFLYPFSVLNGWLMKLTSMNCATMIVAVMMTFFSTYSVLFFRRIFREIMLLEVKDCNLLTALLFSFAYVLLVTFVDDHFGMSLFFLSMTLYLAGKHQMNHTGMPWWQTALLFFMTAGITLSNGAKTFLAALFTNGKQLFRPKYLLLGIIFPTLLIGAAGVYQNRAFIIPNRMAGLKIVQQKAERDSTYKAKMAQKEAHDKAIAGEKIQKNGMLSWADMSISRTQSLVDNVFGESLMLHKEHLLEDIHSHRPIFEKYQNPVPYVVEVVIFCLLLTGLWMGRKHSFLWLVASWVACDAFIHLVLGFGLNEVYIMTAHWAFVIPIAIGYILKQGKERYVAYLRGLLAVITIFLFFYNATLIVDYLTR